MTEDIPSNLYNLLKNVVKDEVRDFTIDLKNNIEGVGYSGEVLFVTLTNKKTQEKHEVVVKQQMGIEGKLAEIVNAAYDNEIYFYDAIWPKLKTFYTTTTGKQFDSVPKCLATTKGGIRGLLFENLHVAGYKTSDKGLILDDNHLDMLFRVYGVFHGISMAFKEKNPQEYTNLVNKIQCGYKDVFSKMEIMRQFLKYVLRNSQSFFSFETEKELIEKLKVCEDNGLQFLCNEESPHRVIKHGDCWSCNMMFKYDGNGQLVDMRLIDFQLIGSGSPVNDLSYFFYGGAHSFSNLDEYLKIYYSSLSDTLNQFGVNVEQVYPFETLKEEWKKHSKFGFFFGLLLWEMKFADPSTVPSFLTEKEFVPFKIRNDKIIDYKTKIRDLVIHMYENDFL